MNGYICISIRLPGSHLQTIGCTCNGDCSALGCSCRKGVYYCSSLYGKGQIDGCTNQHIIPEENNDKIVGFKFVMDI